MTARIIQFPRPALPDEKGVYGFGDGIPQEGKLYTRCEDTFHLFAEPEGRCQCGQETWPKDAGELP